MELKEWPTCALCLEPVWFPSQWKYLHDPTTSKSRLPTCQQSTTCCYHCLCEHLRFLYKDRAKPNPLRCLFCKEQKVLPPIGKQDSIPFDDYIVPQWILMKLDSRIYSCDSYKKHSVGAKECTFQGTQMELFQHETQCTDRNIDCMYCQEMIGYREWESKTHLIECSQCCSCPQCLQYIPKKDVKEHMKKDHDRIKCSWCLLYVRTDKMEFHRLTRCSERNKFVSCPFAITCSEMGKMKYYTLGQHFQKDHIEPIDKMLETYQGVLQTLDSSTTKSATVRSFWTRQKRWVRKAMEDYEFEKRLVCRKLKEWQGE